jgi:lysyl-tRNA synthetase class II
MDFYPHKFEVEMTVEQLTSKFKEHLSPESPQSLAKTSIAGRIKSIRSASKNLFFIDIEDSGHKVQLIVNKKEYSGDNFEEVTGFLKRGDIIGV